MAYLLGGDHQEYQFSYMELYGGAHVVFPGNGSSITVTTIVGDDTSYLHVGPNQTVQLTEVRELTYILSHNFCPIISHIIYE